MGLKSIVRQALDRAGYTVYNRRKPHIYSEDGLSTIHVHDFIDRPAFKQAYARAVQANGADHHMRWRAHVALWVARQAIDRPGAFVECGVSTGFLASAIMQSLGWNGTDRHFYLFDTWEGLDARYLSEREAGDGRLDWYSTVKYDNVVKNFAEFRNVHMIRGAVPDTLPTADIGEVCYLSLDMNCTAPEIAAIRYFWPKLVPGGFVLLDDYAYSGYEEQHRAFDAFAAAHGVEILSLPTGQGLILKPAARA